MSCAPYTCCVDPHTLQVVPFTSVGAMYLMVSSDVQVVKPLAALGASGVAALQLGMAVRNFVKYGPPGLSPVAVVQASPALLGGHVFGWGFGCQSSNA